MRERWYDRSARFGSDCALDPIDVDTCRTQIIDEASAGTVLSNSSE